MFILKIIMIVIVPHKDIELKLINSQKNIIKNIINNTNNQIPYAFMPLWIKTDFSSTNDAKEKIQRIIILNPEYNDDNSLVCPVKIETEKGILKSKLNFICNASCHCEERSDTIIHIDDDLFPLDVKIFRLGECTSSKPGVYELSSTVWKILS